MPGGTGPAPCAFNTLSFTNQFFNPSFIDGDFNTTYHLEDSLTLSWYGGPPPSDGRYGTYQAYGLYLQNYNVQDAALITNVSIVERQIFTYATENWILGPSEPDYECYGGSQMRYKWQIPKTLNLTDTRFQFLAENKTSTVNARVNNSTFKSPGFFIASKGTSSTSSATSTISATPTGTTTILPTANSDTSTLNQGESTGLSTGAKAGFGIGCALIAILGIFTALFLIRRRRNRQMTGENDAGFMGGLGKSDLDAVVVRKAKVVSGAYGPERMELDVGRRGDSRPADLGWGD